MVKATISWNEYNLYLDKITNLIKSETEDRDYDILGISRGGLILAASVAYKLNIKNVFSVGIRSYTDNNKQQEFFIYQSITLADLKKDILLIDDISDTGNTFNYLLSYYNKIDPEKNIKTVSLATKTNTKHKPNFSIQCFDDTVWVEFPWD
jgi:hypoxanthine phosphoribosyltransferase